VAKTGIWVVFENLHLLQHRRNLCYHDIEVKNLLDAEVKGQQPHGGDQKSEEWRWRKIKVNNIPLDPPKPEGNSQRRGLRKLHKYAEEKHREDVKAALEEVTAGRLSVHRALINTGF
jgi:histidinol-phosphate/aromatic aminotransferase/cobyric acid decarboxylase-like protein